ncbi:MULTISPECIES: curli-like amyloid fiber formation chaperone CsgH [unclassified Flavobacterium]|uniref:curli-like amyloid fiber formation chaperone CsgH n=1 Tax=unclassified Flavobacterium TaxID=196869 RepID=UPI003F918932
MKKKMFVYIVLILSFGSTYSQMTNSIVKAKIDKEEVDGNIKVTGIAENLTDIVQSLTYKLSIIRKNSINGNHSTNEQEGLFNLNPSETKKLSETQINVGEGDEVIVMLLFYNESKKLIGKDRIAFDEKKKMMQI